MVCRGEPDATDSVGDANGLLLASESVVPELKRGPMLRGANFICAGGGTSRPEPNVTEKVGTRPSFSGNANFSESEDFSAG